MEECPVNSADKNDWVKPVPQLSNANYFNSIAWLFSRYLWWAIGCVQTSSKHLSLRPSTFSEWSLYLRSDACSPLLIINAASIGRVYGIHVSFRINEVRLSLWKNGLQDTWEGLEGLQSPHTLAKFTTLQRRSAGSFLGCSAAGLPERSAILAVRTTSSSIPERPKRSETSLSSHRQTRDLLEPAEG